MSKELSTSEAAQLAACETVIARGVQTFVAVGSALMKVRDAQLYRAGHRTFEDYCERRWSISRPRAYQLMEAATAVSTVVDKIGVPPPANEGQARELAKVPEAERAEVWQEAVERTEGKPTAAAVREVREERQAPTEPAPVVEAMTSAIESVAEAIDRHLPPDPDDPHREWRRSFLAALGQGRRAMQFDVEAVAERADDECLDELRRLSADITSYTTRVAARRPAPDNVRHLKAI